jgi:hypothetical protein
MPAAPFESLLRLLRTALARWQRLGARPAQSRTQTLLPAPDSTVLDYLAHDTLRQPDPTTCGSSSLVVAQMIIDPRYARRVLDGPKVPLIPQTTQERFAEAALQMHERTNALTDADAALQIPWPKALGTLPWAAARQLNIDLPNADYHVLLIDPAQMAKAFTQISTAVQRGFPVPLYVGDSVSPRHVVLAITCEQDLTIYEPSRGELRDITALSFTGSALDVAGWDQPWLAVLPG